MSNRLGINGKISRDKRAEKFSELLSNPPDPGAVQKAAQRVVAMTEDVIKSSPGKCLLAALVTGIAVGILVKRS